MDALVDRFKKLPASKYHVHESVVCQMLHITGTDGASARSKLSNFILALRGPAYGMIDLMVQGNDLKIHVALHGQKEAFQTNLLADIATVFREPRWFSFGLQQMGIKKQLIIMKAVTGEARKMDKAISDRRKAIWLDWYNNVSTREFESSHLPIIAQQYCDEWEAPAKEGLLAAAKDGRSLTRIDAQILRCIAKEIRAILLACNRVVRTRTRSHGHHPREEPSGESKEIEESEEVSVSPPKRQRLFSNRSHNLVSPSPARQALPESLKMEALRSIDIHELANIERAICVQNNEPISAQEYYRQKQLKEPATITLLDLGALNQLLLGMASRRVKCARKELLGRIPGGLFLPNDNDLLINWIIDGERYSNGARLHANIYEIHPSNERLWLTDKAASYIRHIIFCFKVPITRFPSLMNCFSVLLLGRSLLLEEFPSVATLTARIFRLHLFDWQFFMNDFQSKITTLNQCGFPRYWYSITDDSKHHKEDRHAALMSALEGDGPCFKLLTTSVAGSKDSDGNSKLNVSTILNMLPLNVVAHYGGNVSDNASDAMLEGEKTFGLLMEELATHEVGEDGLVMTNMVHGVRRRVVRFGDPFHIDNLAVKDASIKAFGEMERDPDNKQSQHSQVHHRQCLQSIYDMFSRDRVVCQMHMNAVLEGTGKSLTVKAVRERQQRWLANQRNAHWVLGAMEMKTVEGKPALVAWAQRVREYSNNQIIRRIAKEVATMLLMPAIIVALHFESELGNYFEVTSNWHAMPGELSTRPGFRMLEMHTLWFEFIMPWWEEAKQNPALRFPKTFEYLNSEVKVADRELKRMQLLAGINAGHAELLKMSDLLMSAPLVFLVLTDPVRGPSLLRAILAIVTESGLDLGGEDWGDYEFDEVDDRPASERHWYILLDEDKSSVTHWFQEIGFMKPCIQADLQKLSKAEAAESILLPRQGVLHTFRVEYPVIFAAIDAKFGLMPSNSRIAEQVHGGLRDSLKEGVSYAFTDAQRSFLVNIEYHYRAARRKLVRERVSNKSDDQPDGVKKRDNAYSGVKHDNVKVTQKMTGDQLLESGSKYDAAKIAKLPEALLGMARVRNLIKRGGMYKNKELAQIKEEIVEERKQRSRAINLTLEELQEMSHELTVGNDSKWSSLSISDRLRIEDLDKLAGHNYWYSLKMSDGFVDQLKLVLPYFWKDNLEGKTKTFLKPLIKKHLDLVKDIADNKVNNTLDPPLDLTNLDRYGRLAIFVKYDATSILSDARAKSQRKRKARDAIFSSGGTKIVDRQRYHIAVEQNDTDDETDVAAANNDGEEDFVSVNDDNLVLDNDKHNNDLE